MQIPDNFEQILDLALLAELRELMDADFGLLLQTYLDDSQIRLAAIEQAVLLQDELQIRHMAHSLKGSSANVGAKQLAAACLQLEQQANQHQLQQAMQSLALIRTAHREAGIALTYLLHNSNILV